VGTFPHFLLSAAGLFHLIVINKMHPIPIAYLIFFTTLTILGRPTPDNDSALERRGHYTTKFYDGMAVGYAALHDLSLTHLYIHTIAEDDSLARASSSWWM
jgi:hypothetical protein